MKIGYVQFNPNLLKIEENLKRVESLLKNIDADLIVLPELFNTGYTFKSMNEVKNVSEKIPGGRTTQFLIGIAKKHNIFISGGISEIDGDDLYNSSAFVGPNGYIGKYRKVHLYYKEKLFFKRGNLGYPIYEIKGVKVGMLICFDWIFPEAMRSLARNGAQIILHSTNLVLPFYQMASRVRALENRVFIIISNRYGKEINGIEKNSFTGGSQIVDPAGIVLISSPKIGDEVKVIDINPDNAKNKDINEFNNLMEDI